MFELSSFFENMSKPMLREVYAKAFGKKGLLNNAIIQSEVISFFSEKNRIANIFKNLEPWQKRCLNLIYHSASRGLSYNELRLTVPVSNNRALQIFLLSMSKEYIIWRSVSSGNPVYLGFKDFVDCFELAPSEEIDSSKSYIGFGNLLDWHICKVLALAKRGELKTNANGQLHRRSRQLCLSSFIATEKISEKAAETELTLIFSFLTQNGWLEQEENSLYPSIKALEFLKKNGFRLHQDVLVWWINMRFRKDKEHCVMLLRKLVAGLPVSDTAFLFWVMDPSYRILDRNKILGWEYLPRPLKELWLLGLVEYQIPNQKTPNKISAVKLSVGGQEWLSSSIMPLPEPSISILPNYDVIASTGVSPRILFVLATLAVAKNDDAFLSFTLEKDYYLSGLRSGFEKAEMEHFRSWIKAPENVAMTLDEWNSSFYGARVSSVRLLKIDDIKILEELSRFPQFREHTEEYISGYGFILKTNQEKKACEILENFGFCPYVEGIFENRAPAPTEEWRKDFVISWPEVSSPDYDLKEGIDDVSLQLSLDSTKYGSLYRKLDTFDLVKVLRYAKMAGTLLSAQIKDPAKRNEKQREITFYVHSLHLSKAPFNAEIQEYGVEDIHPLALSFIQEVKVLLKKEL